ncbi:MAG: UvrB/UvrC motif-containing protein, partial [Thermoanaerobaculia bacterium]|nr:UvrB/UvrC motif-containing protein [Thermoanaerobaculia bacterium]
LEETERRRITQQAYNEAEGIEPATILKDIHSPLVALSNLDYSTVENRALEHLEEIGEAPIGQQIEALEKRMRAAAKRLEFEEAAVLRDRIKELRELQIYVE